MALNYPGATPRARMLAAPWNWEAARYPAARRARRHREKQGWQRDIQEQLRGVDPDPWWDWPDYDPWDLDD